MGLPLSIRFLAALLMAACVGTLLLLRRQPHLPPPTARLNTVQASPTPTIAPTPMSTPAPIPQRLRRGPVSPYEIRDYVLKYRSESGFSLNEYWRKLRVDDGDMGWYGVESIALFHLALDELPGDETVLRLFNDGLCRYLVFKPVVLRQRKSWKFLGVIESYQRWKPSRHRLVNTATQRWLAITYLAGHGSGYGLNHEDWYAINSSGIKKVLSYPTNRFTMGWQLMPEMASDSTVLKVSEEEGVATISMRFSVNYSTYDEKRNSSKEILLWQTNQLVTYQQSPGSKRFLFDRAHSQITQREMNVIYDGEGTSNDEVVRYNYPQLVRLSNSKRKAVKEWLKGFLTVCSDSPRQRSLLRRLR